MPTLASKMVEVDGKQIDVRLLTGVLRIHKDCYRAPYKYISSKTSLSMDRVRSIMEDKCSPEGWELECLSDVLFGDDVEEMLDLIAWSSGSNLGRTMWSKLIDICDWARENPWSGIYKLDRE